MQVLLYCWLMAKEFTNGFYNTTAWKNCREEYKKMRGYLCEDCLARGIYTPGVIVHHIEELTPLNIYNPEITLNFNNLRLVCRKCHEEEHRRRKGLRYTVDQNGRVTAI